MARPTRLSVPRSPCAIASALLCSTALLSACGGGNDSTTAPIDAPPQTVSQTISVVDGPIQGALVCLDKNANGVCDIGEPQGKTAADGSVTLSMPAADAHQYAVLAVVDTDAVDADHGPVTTAFTLKAPADQPAVVSPLTTLVAAQAEAANSSSADAEKAVQDKLGISSSLFANFSGQSDSASQHAATVARLLVVTIQQQTADTAAARDGDGKPLARAEVDAAIRQSLLAVLPSVAAAAADPAVARAASASDKAAAIQAAATQVAAEAGLTSDNLASVVSVAKLPPAPDSTEAPSAGAVLRWFSFTDAGNYSLRMFKATAQQNTVVNGQRQFTEYREQSRASNGVVNFYQQWGEGLNNWPRNFIVWTGSAWFDCPTDHVHQATPWDAKGQSESLYCQAYKGSGKRVARDIAGLKMADLVKEIRAYPLADNAGKFSAWGPDPTLYAGALSDAFPAGSILYYQSGTDLANPDGYGTGSGDLFVPYNAAVAAGGGAGAECQKVSSSTFARYQASGSTLEQLVAASTGTPCVYGVPANTGETANEWWGNSTVNIGDVADPYSNATGYYRSGLKDLRVSFAAGNVASYWLCLRRASDGSPRNCASAGSGSYSIETLGDARVLRLAGQPAIAASLSYHRIMVERGGRVYYGSRSKLAVTHQLRPNGVASQALFTALGMPAPRSAAPLTADSLIDQYLNTSGAGTFNRTGLASMPNDNGGLVGAWAMDSSTDPGAQVFFFFANGDYVMADPQGDTVNFCGGPGLERGRYGYDAASGTLSILASSLDTNGCAGLHDTSNPGQPFPAPLQVVLAGNGQSASVTFSDGSGSANLIRLSR